MDSYRKLVKAPNGAVQRTMRMIAIMPTVWNTFDVSRQVLSPIAFRAGEIPMSGTTLTGFVPTVIGGIPGGIAVGKAMKEHSHGSFVDAVAGAAGAVLGSLFLRLSLEQTTLQIVVGAVEGAILALGIEKNDHLRTQPEVKMQRCRFWISVASCRAS